MGNMSYCRFENTANDLADCEDNFGEKLSSEDEIRARKKLLIICKRIANDYTEEDLLEREEEK